MQPRLKVERAKVADLAPYAGNAKQHDVDAIAASIDQFGMCDPVGIWHDADGTPVIVEGHGRVLALKQLGIEHCPVIALDHLDDDARRAYTHIHNQTTMLGGFDMDALRCDLDSIPGFDWGEYGFDIPDAKPEAFDPSGIVEDEPPGSAPESVRRGEVWQCGEHRVMCGDSTSADDLETLLGGSSSIRIHRPAIRGEHRRQEQADKREAGGWQDARHRAEHH